jgi:hypothetical protein
MAWWDDESPLISAGDDPYYVHVLEARVPNTLDLDDPEDAE